MLRLRLQAAGVVPEMIDDPAVLVFNRRMDAFARVAPSSHMPEVCALRAPLHEASVHPDAPTPVPLSVSRVGTVAWLADDILALQSADRTEITFVGLQLPGPSNTSQCRISVPRVRWQSPAVLCSDIEANGGRIVEGVSFAELVRLRGDPRDAAHCGDSGQFSPSRVAPEPNSLEPPVFGPRMIPPMRGAGLWVETPTMLVQLVVTDSNLGDGGGGLTLSVRSKVSFLASSTRRRGGPAATLASTPSKPSSSRLPPQPVLSSAPSAAGGGSGSGTSQTRPSGDAALPSARMMRAAVGQKSNWTIARDRAFLLLGNRLAVYDTTALASTCILRLAVPRGTSQVFASQAGDSVFVVGPENRLIFFSITQALSAESGALRRQEPDDLDVAVGGFRAADLYGADAAERGADASLLVRNTLGGVTVPVRMVASAVESRPGSPTKSRPGASARANIGWATAITDRDGGDGVADVSRIVVLLLSDTVMQAQIIDAVSFRVVAAETLPLAGIAPIRLSRHSVHPSLVGCVANKDGFQAWLCDTSGGLGRALALQALRSHTGSALSKTRKAAQLSAASQKLAPTVSDVVRAEIAAGRRGVAEAVAVLNGMPRFAVVESELSESAAAGPTVFAKVLEDQVIRTAAAIRRLQKEAVIERTRTNAVVDEDVWARLPVEVTDARDHTASLLLALMKVVRGRFEGCARDGASYTLLRENLRLCIVFASRLVSSLVCSGHDLPMLPPLDANAMRELVDTASATQGADGLQDRSPVHSRAALPVGTAGAVAEALLGCTSRARASLAVYRALFDVVPRGAQPDALPPFKTVVRESMRGATVLSAAYVRSAATAEAQHGLTFRAGASETEAADLDAELLLDLVADARVGQALHHVAHAAELRKMPPMLLLVNVVKAAAGASLQRNAEVQAKVVAAMTNLLRPRGARQWLAQIAQKSVSPRAQLALTAQPTSEAAARRHCWMIIAAAWTVASSGDPLQGTGGTLPSTVVGARHQHFAMLTGDGLTSMFEPPQRRLTAVSSTTGADEAEDRPIVPVDLAVSDVFDGSPPLPRPAMAAVDPAVQNSAIAQRQCPPFLAGAPGWLAEARAEDFDAACWEGVSMLAADGGAGPRVATTVVAAAARTLASLDSAGRRCYDFFETGLNLLLESGAMAGLRALWDAALRVSRNALPAPAVVKLFNDAAHRMATLWPGGAPPTDAPQLAAPDAQWNAVRDNLASWCLHNGGGGNLVPASHEASVHALEKESRLSALLSSSSSSGSSGGGIGDVRLLERASGLCDSAAEASRASRVAVAAVAMNRMTSARAVHDHSCLSGLPLVSSDIANQPSVPNRVRHAEHGGRHASGSAFVAMAARSWSVGADELLASLRPLPPPVNVVTTTGAEPSSSDCAGAVGARWIDYLHAGRPVAAAAAFHKYSMDIGCDDADEQCQAAMETMAEVARAWLSSHSVALERREAAHRHAALQQLLASWTRTLGFLGAFARLVRVPPIRRDWFIGRAQRAFAATVLGDRSSACGAESVDSVAVAMGRTCLLPDVDLRRSLRRWQRAMDAADADAALSADDSASLLLHHIAPAAATSSTARDAAASLSTVFRQQGETVLAAAVDSMVTAGAAESHADRADRRRSNTFADAVVRTAPGARPSETPGSFVVRLADNNGARTMASVLRQRLGKSSSLSKGLPEVAVIPGAEAVAEALAVVAVCREALPQRSDTQQFSVVTAAAVDVLQDRLAVCVTEDEAGSDDVSAATLKQLQAMLQLLLSMHSNGATADSAAPLPPGPDVCPAGTARRLVANLPSLAQLLAVAVRTLPWETNPKRALRGLARVHGVAPDLVDVATGNPGICALIQPLNALSDRADDAGSRAARVSLPRFATFITTCCSGAHNTPDNAAVAVPFTADAAIEQLAGDAPGLDQALRSELLSATITAARETSPLAAASSTGSHSPDRPGSRMSPQRTGTALRSSSSLEGATGQAPRSTLTAGDAAAWDAARRRFRALVLDSPIYDIASERVAMLDDYVDTVEAEWAALGLMGDGAALALAVLVTELGPDALAADQDVLCVALRAAAVVASRPGSDLASTAEPSLALQCLAVLHELGVPAEADALAYICHKHAIAAIPDIRMQLPSRATRQSKAGTAMRSATSAAEPAGQLVRLSSAVAGWPTATPARPMLEVENPSALEQLCQPAQLRWFLATFAIPGVSRVRNESIIQQKPPAAAVLAASSSSATFAANPSLAGISFHGLSGSYSREGAATVTTMNDEVSRIAQRALTMLDSRQLQLPREARTAIQRAATPFELASLLTRVLRLAAQAAGARHSLPAVDLVRKLLVMLAAVAAMAEEDSHDIWWATTVGLGKGLAAGRYGLTVHRAVQDTLHAKRDKTSLDHMQRALESALSFDDDHTPGFNCPLPPTPPGYLASEPTSGRASPAGGIGPTVVPVADRSSEEFVADVFAPICEALWVAWIADPRAVTASWAGSRSRADIALAVGRTLVTAADDLLSDGAAAARSARESARLRFCTATATFLASEDAAAIVSLVGFDARLHRFSNDAATSLVSVVAQDASPPDRSDPTRDVATARLLLRHQSGATSAARVLALVCRDRLAQIAASTNECHVIAQHHGEHRLPTGARVALIKLLEATDWSGMTGGAAPPSTADGGSPPIEAICANLRYYAIAGVRERVAGDNELAEALQLKGWKGGKLLASEKDVCRRQDRVLESIERRYRAAAEHFLRDGAIEPLAACLVRLQLLALQRRHLGTFRNERPLVALAASATAAAASQHGSTAAGTGPLTPRPASSSGAGTGSVLHAPGAVAAGSSNGGEDPMVRLCCMCPDALDGVAISGALRVSGGREWGAILFRKCVASADTSFATALRRCVVSVSATARSSLDECVRAKDAGGKDKGSVARRQRLLDITGILTQRAQ